MDFIRAANGDIIIPSIDYGRHCVRCGDRVYRYADFGGAHLCKDIVARLRDANDADFADYARSLVVYGGEG
jgi:hypothetical protein